MYNFKVTYYETSKPTGKRSFRAYYPNYEDILFDAVMDTIHTQATNGYHYDWMFLNNSVFIQRTNMNTMICEYDVQIYHPLKEGELSGNYKVEIECLNLLEEIQNQDELFYHYREIGVKYKEPEPRKSRQLASWLQNEDRRIKWFIIQLNSVESLKALKKELSKATYYRNLRECEQKGYIQNGKLVKRVFITKLD